VSPSAGSGTSQSFTFKYSSSLGYTNLGRVFGQINSSTNGFAACFFEYAAINNTLYLYNDSGSGFVGNGFVSPPPQQQPMHLLSFTASGTGNQLTVTLAITFTNSFGGPKNILRFCQWIIPVCQVVGSSLALDPSVVDTPPLPIQ